MAGVMLGEIYGRGYAGGDLGFMAGVMLGEIWALWQGLC